MEAGTLGREEAGPRRPVDVSAFAAPPVWLTRPLHGHAETPALPSELISPGCTIVPFAHGEVSAGGGNMTAGRPRCQGAEGTVEKPAERSLATPRIACTDVWGDGESGPPQRRRASVQRIGRNGRGGAGDGRRTFVGDLPSLQILPPIPLGLPLAACPAFSLACLQTPRPVFPSQRPRRLACQRAGRYFVPASPRPCVRLCYGKRPGLLASPPPSGVSFRMQMDRNHLDPGYEGGYSLDHQDRLCGIDRCGGT